MEEQEKAIGMKSTRAYTGILTYIDTVSGKTIPENEYEMKYKNYTAKIRQENIIDVRKQLITAQNNPTKHTTMTNDEMVSDSLFHLIAISCDFNQLLIILLPSY